MTFFLGQTARRSKMITKSDVETMAELSGDKNPLHLDEEYAKKTRFGKCIAHGIWPSALISAVLGMDLPGPGTIYLSQFVKFLRPCYIGDTITAIVTINEIMPKNQIKLQTNVINQNRKELVIGEAIVINTIDGSN